MTTHQLSTAADFKKVLNATAAGTGDTLTATEVDMLGFTSVCFVTHIGTVTSTGVATLTAKNSDTSATYGAGTIDTLTHPATGATVQAVATTGDSDTLLVLDIYRPPRRYVRAQIIRATANVVVASMIAIKYNATTQAVSQSGCAAAGYQKTSNPIPSAT